MWIAGRKSINVMVFKIHGNHVCLLSRTNPSPYTFMYITLSSIHNHPKDSRYLATNQQTMTNQTNIHRNNKVVKRYFSIVEEDSNVTSIKINVWCFPLKAFLSPFGLFCVQMKSALSVNFLLISVFLLISNVYTFFVLGLFIHRTHRKELSIYIYVLSNIALLKMN